MISSDDMVDVKTFINKTNNLSSSRGDEGRTTSKKNGSSSTIKCDICLCEMSSDSVLATHLNGSRHKKRMKALEIVANLEASGEKVIQIGIEDKQNIYYHCGVCSLSMNSPQQLEIHLAGAKHKNKIAKEKLIAFSNIANNQDEGTNNLNHPPAKKKKAGQSLCCNLCNIIMNSEVQFEQHLLSKKHCRRSGQNGVRNRGLRKKPIQQNLMGQIEES